MGGTVVNHHSPREDAPDRELVDVGHLPGAILVLPCPAPSPDHSWALRLPLCQLVLTSPQVPVKGP